MLAQEEARRLGHNFVGTEQILLGLIGEGTGLAAKALKTSGVTLKDARVEVEQIIGRGTGFVAVEIPFTPRAKRVLELSWDSARELGHNYIGTEHLLMGLCKEGGGVASRVLSNLDVDATTLPPLLVRYLTETGCTAPAPKAEKTEKVSPDAQVVLDTIHRLHMQVQKLEKRLETVEQKLKRGGGGGMS